MKLDMPPETFRLRTFGATLLRIAGLGASILGAGLLFTGCDTDVHHDFSRVSGPNSIVGSGNVIGQSRTVSGFHGVSLSGAGRLIVDRNGFESLTITAEDNLLPYLTSRVSGGLLELGTTPGVSLNASREILYEVSARTFDELVLSGAGDIELMGLDTPYFRTTISGAGNVIAFGEATEQHVTISGAGRYDAEGLDSRVAHITVSGAAFARLRVSGELHVSISGAGTVEYYGDPVVHVSGEGSVRRLGP